MLLKISHRIESVTEGLDQDKLDSARVLARTAMILTERYNSEELGVFERIALAEELCVKEQGYGACKSCGHSGKMYGSGAFCGKCNNLWCVVYAEVGYALEVEDMIHLQLGVFSLASTNVSAL